MGLLLFTIGCLYLLTPQKIRAQGKDNAASVNIRDVSGRIINVQKTRANVTLRLGEKWATGTYFAEVIQGDQRKVVKLVKSM